VKSRALSLFATVLIAALSGMPATPAHATLTTSSHYCNQAAFQGFPTADRPDRIHYSGTGVVNMSNAPAQFICPVPMLPMAPGATAATFFMDGNNTVSAGASTFCILSSFTFGGTFRGARGFTTSAPIYDEFVSMPVELMGNFDYLVLQCTLPPASSPGNFTATFRGITVMQ
jgi:hypothetical protein